MRNFVFYFLRAFGLLFILRKMKGDKITVLCFHRISNENSPSWPPLKVNVFSELLKYINKNYDVISHFEMSKPTKKKKLIITFDDGYRDFLENALPLLEKYKMPSNLNVVVGCIENNVQIWTQQLNRFIEAAMKCGMSQIAFSYNNEHYTYILEGEAAASISTSIFLDLLKCSEKERNERLTILYSTINISVVKDEMLNWEDIIFCSNKDVLIGSHTYSHLNLSSVIDDETMERELQSSKQIITRKIGKVVDSIAFPNGQFNKETIRKSKEFGYKYIYLVDDKLFCLKKEAKCHVISRILIQHDTFIENCFKIENFHSIFRC